MQKYAYTGLIRFGIAWRQAMGILGLSIFSALAVLMFWAPTQMPLSGEAVSLWDDIRITPICLGLWCLLVAWTVGMTLVNAAPTIWVSESGLVISAFLFSKILIPWSDVTALQVGKVRFGHDLVIARRISPFHLTYGWLFAQKLVPAFIIDRRIEDHDRLIREIVRRAKLGSNSRR